MLQNNKRFLYRLRAFEERQEELIKGLSGICVGRALKNPYIYRNNSIALKSKQTSFSRSF